VAAGHPPPSQSGEHGARSRRPPAGGSTAVSPPGAAVVLVDAVLGLGLILADRARQVAQAVEPRVRPLSLLLAVPVGLGRSIAEQRWVAGLVEAGTLGRWQATENLRLLAHRAVPQLVDAALRLVDLTDVVRRNVDLDAIVDDVDVDAVVARVDLDAVVDRIDVDAIVSRVDLDAIVDRIDVDAIVARVDLDAIVDRIDIDAVAARIDIAAILDRVDVDSVVGRADMDAIIARIDLIDLAEDVVEGIDLPGIIRSSTGSMASEGVREVRRQGISADERVAHLVDRLLHRPDRIPGSTNHQPVAALPSVPHDGNSPEATPGHAPEGE